MDPTPEYIATEALTAIGTTPGPDPVRQIQHLAEHLSTQLRDARDQWQLTGQIPEDLDGYNRLRDHVLIARVACVHIQQAEVAELQAMLDTAWRS